MSPTAALLPDRLGGAPDGKRSLRLWLRLLTCTTTIEQTVAQRLRDSFDTTLPRFDLLAALDRAGDPGLTMGEAAAMLKADGLIESLPGPDRRVQRIRLTPAGRTRFAVMAAAHERWIETLFAGLDDAEAETLTHLLERTKRSLQTHTEPTP